MNLVDLPLFLKQFYLILLFLFSPHFTWAAATSAPPNVLIIMTDDQGRWSLGEYDDRIVTPNIDYLANNGVRFDQAITPTPVCSAARASFYTGRLASQHGVHGVISKNGDRDDWLENERLISEILDENGYRVGLFGKWHADTRDWKPARGFHRWLSYDERAASWINSYQHSGTVHFSRDGTPFQYTGIQARYISESTVDFIDENDERPFAAFVNYVEPHWPFEGLPERLVSFYRDFANEIVSAGDTSSLQGAGNLEAQGAKADHVEKLSQYLAAVTLVDEQVGHLLDALEGRNLLKNTLIIFTSDHGHLTGQYGLYGKGNATIPQNLYQDSINIPLIVYGPKRLVVPGQVRNDFVNLYDVFPTLVEVINAGPQLKDYDGPGKSLLPLLRGERVTAFRNFQFAEYGNTRMVHSGRWKLVRYYQKDASSSPKDYWYDLAHPLGERFSVPPPSKSQQLQLIGALEKFFETYETKEHSGRRIWDLPRQRAGQVWH